MIFFAPGIDPWTESILQNAFQSDRGRCCALRRSLIELTEFWSGFEFFYRLQIDPRPLYCAGCLPIHISLAQEYLPLNSYRILVSEDGEVLPEKHPYYGATRRSYNSDHDLHLGIRSGPSAPIDAFKLKYPPELWINNVASAFAVAQSYIKDVVFHEYGFDIESQAAREMLTRRLNGRRAAIRWKHRANDTEPSSDLRETVWLEKVYDALVDGVAKPWLRIESATYWQLEPFGGRKYELS